MKLTIEPQPEKRISSEKKKYKSGKGYVYHESSQPFYKLKVLLKDLESNPKLFINSIKKPVYYIPRLIEFIELIEQINTKEIINIHTAGLVNHQGKGILISGQQDVGKTSLTFKLAQEGYKIIGDDVAKISKAGEIIQMEEKAGIYPHPDNLKQLDLPWWRHLEGWFKLHFAQFPFVGSIVYPNVEIDYEKIGEVAKKSQLKRVYFLNKSSTKKIEPLDKEQAIDKILSTSLDLFVPSQFPRRFFYMYAFANDISPTFVEDSYREILETVFEDKQIFNVYGSGREEFYDLIKQKESEL